MRTVAFIDGFNLYHSLAEAPSGCKRENLKIFRWLDLKKLCQKFLTKSDNLTDVYYFTAFAHWDGGKVDRHKKYIQALETTGVRVVIGNFKKVTKKCRKCFKKYKTYEEKETDVNIASYLLKGAFKNEYDQFFILSADSDLIPPIKIIHDCFPNKISKVILPPNSCSNLKDIAKSNSRIRGKHLKNSLFPNVISFEEKSIFKPENW